MSGEMLRTEEILSREEVSKPSKRVLERERWAGTVDSVGGFALVHLIRTIWGARGLRYGEPNLRHRFFPFILRRVRRNRFRCLALTTIESTFGSDWVSEVRPPLLESIAVNRLGFGELPNVFEQLLHNQNVGRVLLVDFT